MYVAMEIFAGVKHCHEHNVCHRDIKPDNICLCRATNGRHRPVLIDFGFAADSSELQTKACGTALYAAPEVYLYKPILYDGKQADVWSCGIILYALALHRLPFQSPKDLRKYRHNPHIAGVTRMPKFCQDIVLRMLLVCPSQRLCIASAVSEMACHLRHIAPVAS